MTNNPLFLLTPIRHLQRKRRLYFFTHIPTPVIKTDYLLWRTVSCVSKFNQMGGIKPMSILGNL